MLRTDDSAWRGAPILKRTMGKRLIFASSYSGRSCIASSLPSESIPSPVERALAREIHAYG